jgi:formylglycine-generating enzyme required for sulfatase activity
MMTENRQGRQILRKFVQRITQTPKVAFDWVTIPAGVFLRGSDTSKDLLAVGSETPQCQIYLSTYQIVRMPVTNAQYKVFVDATGHQTPEHWPAGEQDGPPSVAVRNRTTLELRIRPGSDRAQREAVLYAWYRRQLRAQIPPLLAKWQPILGVDVADWRIKKMKTRWGSCTIEARAHLAQPRTRQKAARLPRIHPRPRNGPPAGASSQRTLPGAHGALPAQLADGAGCPESSAVGA